MAPQPPGSSLPTSPLPNGKPSTPSRPPPTPSPAWRPALARPTSMPARPIMPSPQVSGTSKPSAQNNCRTTSTDAEHGGNATKRSSRPHQAGMPRRACGTCGTDPTGHPAARHQQPSCTAELLSSGSSTRYKRVVGSRQVVPIGHDVCTPTSKNTGNERCRSGRQGKKHTMNGRITGTRLIGRSGL